MNSWYQLWIVRTTTNPMSEPTTIPSRDSPLLGECAIIAVRRRGQVWESLVQGKRGRAERLLKLPGVVEVTPAQDGAFSDKSFGTVVISNNATRYSFEGPGPRPPYAGDIRRLAMTEPRWQQRHYREKRNQSSEK